MKTLDRKLLRDLWKMKGQAFAIVLVIISGVATFVMFLSTMNSLNLTRTRFYQDYRFADVFASLKRAPEGLKYRISEIPGVDKVETRVVADVKLDIKGFHEPVTAKLISLPDDGRPLLNMLYLRKGRMVETGKDNEVIISEAFAEAHGFSPHDTFGAVINGRWKTLVIAGIALSPEHVLQVRPGAISPDYKRYGILWMNRSALEAAYNMKGAFNDLALTLSADAKIGDVLVHMDNLLERYGGLGAYGRKDQMSHRYLTEEFRQLQRMAEMFPAIFISVAAFLLNVVINRIVSTQRDQIAILKAFGYSNLNVGLHYVKLVILIVLLGVGGGLVVGAWLGNGLGNIYMEFYRFPFLMYELRPSVAAAAAFISIGAALAGTVYAVWKAAVFPPAEAMRPEPPAQYRATIIERMGLQRFFSQPSRMIIRNIERRPIKSLLSIIGIALACAIMMAGRFSKDAIDFMVDVQFGLSHKEDMAVTFVEPASMKAVHEMKDLKGVQYAEIFRTVPVRFKFQHRSYRTTIQGIEPDSRLHFLLDTHLKPIHIPSSGIVLTDYLGNILGIKPGDMLTVEVMEGSRPVRQVPVVALVKEYIGLSGYMNLTALNRLLREGDAVSGAYLTVDALFLPEIYRTLIELPRVAGTVVIKDEVKNFYDTHAEAFLFFVFVATLLAGSIAFGVVYNSARIALSERSRELASLRVLGYTRAEISYILLGELALLSLAAIPVGFLIGRGLCAYMSKALESDLYRVPLILESATYSLSATVVLASAFVSGVIISYRLYHLDLVAVLKTKE
ncbi:MAG: ABC transporter permease [Deltaproteobacteria bacterium RIFCSPLOWO2_12_FULL_43_16]|nr:MAG: ABC transporter permease [Deltaproteobacteria bacterium GWA2_43_19]OGQ24314.1 MAG: ABC transporter permease [Deltaproteobacteria bacterium RIFCSPHIGHO2_02_FULL_42_44]OGQ59288.1 MAG: ABC transporter permease [Deltaproteobacteria bacterium RIFCSPLOWO2_12_FULL_43_16]HBR16158.1 ABC transporter permease [Deltaproteobacteria bacterium]